MVGIACSIIVVLVTTYMQFRFEQNKILASVLSSLRFFFFDYLCIAMALDPNEQVPKRFWEYDYDKVEKHIREITSELLSIEWFSKKKNNLVIEIQRQFLILRVELSKTEGKDKETLVKGVIGLPAIKEIKDGALQLAEGDGYTYIKTEIVKDYEEAEKCIAKYRTANVQNLYKGERP